MIATARRIEWLEKDYPSPNVDNLMTVLRSKLKTLCKELKESVAAMADKMIEQPAAVLLSTATVEHKYFAPPSGMRAPQR